jgi:hypothetical protein
MTPRAAKLMQPARGQVRIGILQDHEITQFLVQYSLKRGSGEPRKWAPNSGFQTRNGVKSNEPGRELMLAAYGCRLWTGATKLTSRLNESAALSDSSDMF